MRIIAMHSTVSRTAIDSGMWKIKMYLTGKHGSLTAERDIAPLEWYINTGRASMDFLRRLFTAKPYMIGRILHGGGSDDDIIERIKAYLYKGGKTE